MKRASVRKDEERREWCLSQGVVLEDHCCLDMAWFLSDSTDFPSQGQNPVIMYSDCHREYRIHISREGWSSTVIFYCPWCGARLPEGLRDTWSKTLQAMGFEDPYEQTIPDEFLTSAWWKNRGL